MDVYRIIRELQNERTKLDQVIASIEELQSWMFDGQRRAVQSARPKASRAGQPITRVGCFLSRAASLRPGSTAYHCFLGFCHKNGPSVGHSYE